MPYRRTEKISRRLVARQAAILEAAQALAAEAGMAAVQIAPVAERAGIAAGTVYRYFQSKTELVTALAIALSDADVAALRGAADGAPGPLSGLAAAIMAFAARALDQRRLAFALIAELVEPDVAAARLAYRRTLAGEFERCIGKALAGGHLPEQDAGLAAAALLGALTEALIGPLATEAAPDLAQRRARVQTLALFGLRALGVVDARARGIVVQTAVPMPAPPRA